MRTKLIAALAGALMLLSNPAGAHLQTQGDGQDVDGKLDMREVAMRHDPHDVTVTFRTYGVFGGDSLKTGVFVLRLERQGSTVPWYYVELAHRNGELRGRLVACNEDRCFYRNGKSVEVSRPTGKSIRVVIPRGKIVNAGSVLRWTAISGDGNYVDRVPNTGVVQHNIGAAG